LRRPAADARRPLLAVDTPDNLRTQTATHDLEDAFLVLVDGATA
jgi:hypothetical protein